MLVVVVVGAGGLSTAEDGGKEGYCGLGGAEGKEGGCCGGCCGGGCLKLGTEGKEGGCCGGCCGCCGGAEGKEGGCGKVKDGAEGKLNDVVI